MASQSQMFFIFHGSIEDKCLILLICIRILLFDLHFSTFNSLIIKCTLLINSLPIHNTLPNRYTIGYHCTKVITLIIYQSISISRWLYFIVNILVIIIDILIVVLVIIAPITQQHSQRIPLTTSTLTARRPLPTRTTLIIIRLRVHSAVTLFTL